MVPASRVRRQYKPRPGKKSPERNLLAAIFLKGHLPNVELSADDFADALHRRIFRAMTRVADDAEDIGTANVWRADRGLDPVELFAIECSLDDEGGANLIDVYGAHVLTLSQLRQRFAA